MTNEKIREFTDLMVWQEGYKLTVEVYSITKTFPKEETYSMTDQLRRSVLSITANIAEGFGRQTYKEKVQFYYMAHGSLTEVKNCLYIARGIGYLTEGNFKSLMNQLSLTHKLLQGLIKKTKEFLNPES